jgi:hypothetical protein
VLPTSFLRIPKTHNSTSLRVWHENVLHFCYFCKPTFSGLPASGTHCIFHRTDGRP